ncbi:ribosome biogenesis protein Noc4 [Guyanagaster necrorhizus]|uniref:Ribosome biogenesis protein Noc4 n=1 Tax=Guyanagaster necrorhizus TaxID=856835 RepID=A0A9P8APD1_9AGAR|nr:ribosome biogenesis protein Noc4 [Guyanagaster necrorhizus MCA 3950]KAG7442820.1 ribosome biogenesis protein Noc4 [Guyanagaster necrorhizus MCA 3950]
MCGLHSLPPPSKKRKLNNDSKVLQSIQDTEHHLTRAVTNNGTLNPLADLLDLTCSRKDSQEVSKGIYALYRVFVLVIGNGKLSVSGDESTKTVKAWLWDRMNNYVNFLVGLLKDEEKSLRVSALQILFSLQKHLSSAATKYSSTSVPQFHISHFRKIVSGLLLCPSSPRKFSPASDTHVDADVLQVFHDTWFSVHDDIRWFFLREAGTLLTTTSSREHPQLLINLLRILEDLTTFPTESSELNAWWVTELGAQPPKPKVAKRREGEDDGDDEPLGDAPEGDWRKFFDDDKTAKDTSKAKTPGVRVHTLTIHQSLHSLPSHRAVFTRTWLELLSRLSVANDTTATKAVATRVLNIMHRGIMPHLTRPVLVMDWIGACVDYGRTVGLLALNALFVLIKEYNLDYPSFYTRLYAFLDRNLLHLKYRARFFRMTELFLSSTHLPATLLASFIKRLARLSLFAPPAGVIILIPFTYNILKRHPALMVMINRTDMDGSEDPFLPAEPNPLSTNALSSSLWELQSHQSHYHSGVSTLVKVFSEVFTKPGFSMEDFLDHTYGTLYDAEANRKIKKEPALGVSLELGDQKKTAAKVFGTSEADDVEEDVINSFWTFGV